MPNNIAVAVTVDVADLQVKRAIMSAELKTAQKDLNDFAKTAQSSGMTDGLRTSMLSAGDAVAKAKNQIRGVDAELKSLNPALKSAQHGMGGIVREGLTIGREGFSSNFHRMAGSVTILAQRMGILTPTVIGAAAAIAALAAPFIVFGIAVEQGSLQAARFKNSMEATNGYAGVTISQLQKMSQTMAEWAHVGIGTASEALMKLAGSGKFSGQTMLLVGEDATRMGQLTGESSDKFIEQFEKMTGGVAKFAQEYQNQYHQLTTAQYTYIRQLEEQGHKEEAEYQLAKNVYDYLGHQAPQNLGYLESAWHGVESAISGAWDKLKAYGRDSNQDQLNKVNDQIAGMKANPFLHASSANEQELASLEAQKKAIEGREAADQRSAKIAGDNAKRQTDGTNAAAQLADKFEASKTSGEKLKKAIADINDELAKAKSADPGNASKYEAEAAAARAQAEKSDTPREKKGPKGPGQVAEWTEQLRAQEIASKNFYSDQTAEELKFWQSKVALTAQGSKDWLEVQGHIYEASKSLARQAYQDKIADLNDALAADRDNWSKEQTDWQTKLAYIRSTFGEQSTEYKNAYREMERAQQEHDAKEQRETEEHIKKQTEELKRSLDTQARAREDDAKAAEAVAKAGAGNSPFGEIAAQRQLAQIHTQVTQQQIADNETLHASESSQLDTAIANAVAKYGQEKSMYQSLLDSKAEADRQYADRKQQLDAQLRQQSIQDTLAMQQAYRNYISGTVNTTISGFDKMISGQMTFKNFGVSIYQSIAREAEQQVAKMATEWIIKHVLMAAASKLLGTAQASTGPAQIAATQATSKAQVAALAGVAGAGGVASMAAAPWPMDMTAPAFGSEMAAAAMSMGSFAQGTNVVPNDMVAQIHAGERIIPKADNDTLINLAARGAGAAGGGGSGGDTHYHSHYSPTVNGQMPFKDQLAAHEDNVISMLQRAGRRGVRFNSD